MYVSGNLFWRYTMENNLSLHLDQTPNSNQNNATREKILTGDRATGSLHLGHFVGSLQ